MDDPNLIAEHFDRFHRRLYALAVRITNDAVEAEDLLQETFLRICRSRKPLPESEKQVEAYLIRILVNLCRDRFRRLKHREQVAAEGDQEDHSDQGGSARSAEAGLQIYNLLAGLDPRRRAILILKEVEDRDVAEIAVLLGITRVTVRWHLMAARRYLSEVGSSSRKQGTRGQGVQHE